eukprot:2187327-Rhodomonas_salina.1
MEGEVERSEDRAKEIEEQGRNRAEQDQRRARNEMQKAIATTKEDGRRELEAAKATNDELSRESRKTLQLLDTAQTRIGELEEDVYSMTDKIEKVRATALGYEARIVELEHEGVGLLGEQTKLQKELDAARKSELTAREECASDVEALGQEIDSYISEIACVKRQLDIQAQRNQDLDDELQETRQKVQRLEEEELMLDRE